MPDPDIIELKDDFDYKTHWTYRLSPEERLNALAHAYVRIGEAFELLRQMQDGIFVPDIDTTLEQEVVNLASLIHSLGEALQGIGIGILLNDKGFMRAEADIG